MKSIREIKDMYENGIVLSSGVKLTPQDLYELTQIDRIRYGMDSYTYVQENIEDVDENGNDIVWPDVEAYDADFYESIYYALQERITGDDEYEEVVRMVRKENGNER